MNQNLEIKDKEVMAMDNITKDSFLEHYGILGQKWGNRRYQNEDGTLTEEGKARYGSKDGKSYDSKSNTWKGKDARNLSDDELNRRNSRLQREKQYRDLTEPPIRKETRSILKKIFVTTAIGVTAAVMSQKYKPIISKGAEWLTKEGAKKFMGAAARGFGKAKWVL